MESETAERSERQLVWSAYISEIYRSRADNMEISKARSL